MHNNSKFDPIFETIRQHILKIGDQPQDQQINQQESQVETNKEHQLDSTRKIKKSVSFRLINNKDRSQSSMGRIDGSTKSKETGSAKKRMRFKSVSTQSNWNPTSFVGDIAQYDSRQRPNESARINYVSGDSKRELIRDLKKQKQKRECQQLDIHKRIRQIRDQVKQSFPLASTKKSQSVPILRKVETNEFAQRFHLSSVRTASSGTSVPSSASRIKNKSNDQHIRQSKELILSKLPTTVSILDSKGFLSNQKTNRLFGYQSAATGSRRVDLAESILKHQIMKKLAF